MRRGLVVLGLVSACGSSGRTSAGLDAPITGPSDAMGPDAADPQPPGRDAANPDAPQTAKPDARTVDAPPPCIPPAPGTAPTYAELYSRYFAADTAGHCATDGCHGGLNYNIWLCGPTKDDCYRGMVRAQLIDPANPIASRIADPTSSPLVWVNPDGLMPKDGTQAFPPGGDAMIARNEIVAWATACAQDN